MNSSERAPREERCPARPGPAPPPPARPLPLRPRRRCGSAGSPRCCGAMRGSGAVRLRALLLLLASVPALSPAGASRRSGGSRWVGDVLLPLLALERAEAGQESGPGPGSGRSCALAARVSRWCCRTPGPRDSPGPGTG